MKILVTGGAGFLGSWIAEELVQLGHNVLIIDDLSGGDANNIPFDAKFFRLDLTNSEPCLLSGIKVDILVHLAANAREGASQFQPISVVRRNTLAYINVLTHCINVGVQKVVLFSSMSVYGAQTPPFNENLPLQPVDIYGMQKANMEQMTACLADVHDFKYTIIRPHNCFGPRQALFDRFRNVIALSANRIMRGEPLIIFGDGQQQRAFSYIEDSLPAYLTAIFSAKANNQVFNIGGDEPITIQAMLEQLKHYMGVDADYPTQYLPARPCEVKYAYSCHTKAEQLLNLRNIVGFEEGLRRTANWAIEQGSCEWRNYDKIEIASPKLPAVWQ